MIATPSMAMHMANELLNLPVALATIAIAGVAVAVGARRARKTLGSETVPLMGVMGAFVFAAQMINFSLPGMPGTSGHLGGGVLLAILLGPAAGILTITSVLIVQCLIFQDGGLLALGCNVLNMGVVPCLLGWSLYRLVNGRTDTPPAWRQYAAAWSASLIGVTAGAACVPVQAALAGRLVAPLADFLAVMLGVHLIIGAIEGIITFAVVAYLRQVRPAALGLGAAPTVRERISRGALATSLIITAVALAGVVSWFASSHPDGLEWSYTDQQDAQGDEVVKPPTEFMSTVDDAHTRYAPLPDYSTRVAAIGEAPLDQELQTETEEANAWPNVDGWGSLAGLIGTAIALAAAYIVSRLLGKKRRVAGPTR